MRRLACCSSTTLTDEASTSFCLCQLFFIYGDSTFPKALKAGIRRFGEIAAHLAKLFTDVTVLRASAYFRDGHGALYGCHAEERFHGLEYGFVPRWDDSTSYAVPPASVLLGAGEHARPAWFALLAVCKIHPIPKKASCFGRGSARPHPAAHCPCIFGNESYIKLESRGQDEVAACLLAVAVEPRLSSSPPPRRTLTRWRQKACRSANEKERPAYTVRPSRQ